jgi:four helix bundle protein
VRYFDHEQLIAYQLAVEVARTVASARFPRGEADLRDQALRASRSVVLNIAEGRARGGGAGKNHYRIALGSAAETCAVFDLATVSGARDLQAQLRRIGAMLSQLAR